MTSASALRAPLILHARRSSHQLNVARTLSLSTLNPLTATHSSSPIVAVPPSSSSSSSSSPPLPLPRPRPSLSSLRDVRLGHRPSLSPTTSPTYKVLLVGAAHSGKTSILHSLLSFPLPSSYSPTPHLSLSLYLLLDPSFTSLELWEVPSLPHVDALSSLYLPHTDATVIVTDTTDLRSFVDVRRWTALLGGHCPVVLLANKADSGERVLSDKSVMEGAARDRVSAAFVVSALTGQGVRDAFHALVPLIQHFCPDAPAPAVAAAPAVSDSTQRILSLLLARRPSLTPTPRAELRHSPSLTPTSRASQPSVAPTSLTLTNPQALLSHMRASSLIRPRPPPTSDDKAADAEHTGVKAAPAKEWEGRRVNVDLRFL